MSRKNFFIDLIIKNVPHKHTAALLQCLQMELLTTVVRNSQKYRHSQNQAKDHSQIQSRAAASSLRTALDTVAPVKKKASYQKYLTPWYDFQIYS